MWLVLIFIIGMLSFLVSIILFKLYKFNGTKFKNRTCYALILSLFLTLFFFWQTGGEIEIILKGCLLGVLLGIPFCFSFKASVDKRLIGSNYIVKRKNLIANALWTLLVVILFQLLIRQNYGKALLESVWPILGVSLSWFFAQAFVFYYVIKLEKKIGLPILEKIER